MSTFIGAERIWQSCRALLSFSYFTLFCLVFVFSVYGAVQRIAQLFRKLGCM